MTKNIFHLDKKNRSWMSWESWNMVWVTKKEANASSRKIDDKHEIYFLPKRRKSYFHPSFVNDVKSSKKPLLFNVSLIFLRCRTFDFFQDEFSKNYKYRIDDICNVRFLERHTKSIWQRIKTRICGPMTMSFFILLWPYFVMFRQFKILIFNSWYTTVDILLFYNFDNLFCPRFRRLEF